MELFRSVARFAPFVMMVLAALIAMGTVSLAQSADEASQQAQTPPDNGNSSTPPPRFKTLQDVFDEAWG
jgi:hypothetical protein